jgi:hypothetical protein
VCLEVGWALAAAWLLPSGPPLGRIRAVHLRLLRIGQCGCWRRGRAGGSHVRGPRVLGRTVSVVVGDGMSARRSARSSCCSRPSSPCWARWSRRWSECRSRPWRCSGWCAVERCRRRRLRRWRLRLLLLRRWRLRRWRLRLWRPRRWRRRCWRLRRWRLRRWRLRRWRLGRWQLRRWQLRQRRFHDQPLAGGLSRAACGGGVLASAMRACCASCLPSRKAVRETAIRSVAGLSHAWPLARDPF